MGFIAVEWFLLFFSVFFGVHRIQNFWIRLDPDQILRRRIRPDPDPSSVITRLYLTGKEVLSQNLSPNASKCDEETEVFLLLLAVASLASKMFPYSDNSLSEYIELAGLNLPAQCTRRDCCPSTILTRCPKLQIVMGFH